MFNRWWWATFPLNVISLFIATAFLVSCASQDKRESSSASTAEKPDAIGKVIEETPSDAESRPKPELRSAAEIENLTIGEVIRIEEPNTANLYDNSRYDFPITMNSKVEGWIDYFTGRGRPHMERYLSRSSRYIPRMKEALRKTGMPEDLVYLALIESGFNLRAKSRAKAVGPWQFIKSTGVRYGLRVDAWIDERRDPLRSTEAASKYLKDLYLMFESWYLAASAYNAGEYKILRAIEELHTNNYWRICETRVLRRETKDYIPKLIAAAIIAKNPNRYGFDDVAYQDPLEFETIHVDFPVRLGELAKIVDAPEEDLEDLNPALRRGIVPPGEAFEIRVPVGSRLIAERAIASLKKKPDSQEVPYQHVVQSGETLAGISKRYKIRVGDLMNVNNINKGERVSPGTALIIPKKHEAARDSIARVKRKISSTPETVAQAKKGNFIQHTVRSGESLWTIAERYNVTVQELFKWNGLKNSRINAGKRLKVKAG